MLALEKKLNDIFLEIIMEIFRIRKNKLLTNIFDNYPIYSKRKKN